jgi:hypothetical protein
VTGMGLLLFDGWLIAINRHYSAGSELMASDSSRLPTYRTR